jgi:hypothetical protein
MDLQKAIEEQALNFANGILLALRGASLEELARMAKGKTTVADVLAARPTTILPRAHERLPRRSPREIERTLDRVVDLLLKHPSGLRAESIKSRLELDARELPKPLARGLELGRLLKTGEKRATVYFAAPHARAGRRRPS